MQKLKLLVLGFFRDKHFLDPEDEAWHLESWRWFLRQFGGIAAFSKTPLVKATPEYFPASDTLDHARAEHIFAHTKKHAHMENWRCTLVAQPKRPESQVSELGLLKPDKGHSPLGTFSVSEEGATITYDPDLLKKPAALIATFAHELAHYLIASRHSDLPGGEEMHEYLTDLMTVFIGFGLFSANATFNFSQFTSALTQGWQSSRHGNLRERDWAFALAVYAVLKKEKPDIFKGELKPHLYEDTRLAWKYLTRHPELLNEHRSMEYG